MQHLGPAALMAAAFVLASCSHGPAGQQEQAAAPVATPAPTAAPGHYAGVLPCATCAGLRTDVQLWAFGGCAVQRQHRDAAEGGTTCSWGRWRMDEQGRLELTLAGGEQVEHFTIRTDGSLVAQDGAGGAPVDTVAYALYREAADLTPTVGEALKGSFFQGRPNVWNFRECHSGRLMLVRFDPEAADIEEGFRKAGGDPAAGLVVELGGVMQPTPLTDDQGTVTLLTIKRWDRFLPGETCPY
ncbi:MAG TPA: copper resistance protein NlpE N-terminal domain-containing protein [Flavobacteriales bacterium]|nr:copper resistance protein NlpE N-terminal domain-containing protein [Flavobacteriales bacterium]HMR29050.1 copper resistance protein NlpE N-terminal domain-containing protein [Flavobacteriales bacterium]